MKESDQACRLRTEGEQYARIIGQGGVKGHKGEPETPLKTIWRMLDEPCPEDPFLQGVRRGFGIDPA